MAASQASCAIPLGLVVSRPAYFSIASSKYLSYQSLNAWSLIPFPLSIYTVGTITFRQTVSLRKFSNSFWLFTRLTSSVRRHIPAHYRNHVRRTISEFHRPQAVRQPFGQLGLHRHGQHRHTPKQVGEFIEAGKFAGEIQRRLECLVF